jgi:hypothetical protein
MGVILVNCLSRRKAQQIEKKNEKEIDMRDED